MLTHLTFFVVGLMAGFLTVLILALRKRRHRHNGVMRLCD
jgi:Flp pilus assembly protein protease CpaA